jgi:TP901 family phage tail tape measure protein
MPGIFEYIIKISDNGSAATLNKIDKGLDGIGKKTSGLGGLFNTSLLNINQFSTAITHVNEGLQQIISPGANFQQQMAEVSAITGIVGADLELLATKSREIGTSTGLGASKAAEGFKLLASNLGDIGIDNLISLNDKVITLSKAASIDLPSAADVVSATLNQFNLKVSDSAKIVDILAAGAKYGAAEIPDLAQSLKVAGATASAAGVDLQSTVAALEVLSQNALKGSEAGTGLRNVMLKLQTSDMLPPGINLKADGLVKTLAKMQPVLSDTTYMAKVFGAENINAAQILIKNAAAVEEMNKNVGELGVSQQQAAINSNTYNNTMAKIKATFEDFGIAVFNATEKFLPLIQSTAGLFDLFGKIGPMFTLLNQGATKLPGLLTRLWTGIVSLGTTLPALWAGLVSAATATWTFTAALLANPITWVVVGVIGLIAAIYLLIKHWETVKNAVRGFIDYAMNGLGRFGGYLRNFVLTVAQYAMYLNPLYWIVRGIDALFPTLKNKLMVIWQNISNFFSGMWSKITNMVPNFIKKALGLGSVKGESKADKVPEAGFGSKQNSDAAPYPSEKQMAGIAGLEGVAEKNSKGLKKGQSASNALEGVSGGIKEGKSVTINIKSLVEQITVSTTTVGEGASQIQRIVEEALIRALQGAEIATG